MGVRDTWLKEGPDGKKVPTTKHGKGDKRWKATWTDPRTGREVSRFFAREREAKDYLAKVRTEQNEGRYSDPRNDKLTFKAYAEAWRATRGHHSEGTAESVDTHLKRVYPIIGHRPIRSIVTSEIQGLISNLPVAASTARTTLKWIRAIFTAAVQDGVLPRTPTPRGSIALPALTSKKITPLPDEAIDLLRFYLRPKFKAMVDTALGTGLRPGELWGLELDDIDWDAGTITVARQVILPKSGGGPYLGPLKTPASYDTILVDEVTLDALQRHLDEFPPVPVAVMDRTDKRSPRPRTAYLVFTTYRNGPINRTTFGNHDFKPALGKVRADLLGSRPTRESRRLASTLDAAITELRGSRKGIGLHVLRHKFASVLINGGCNILEVQKRCRHASAKETLDTYGHLMPQAEMSRPVMTAYWDRLASLSRPAPRSALRVVG